MHDEADIGERKAGRGERRHDAERLVVGRRRRLGDVDLAAVAAVDQDEVGKGAADIDSGDDLAARLREFARPSTKSEMPELRMRGKFGSLFPASVLTR